MPDSPAGGWDRALVLLVFVVVAVLCGGAAFLYGVHS